MNCNKKTEIENCLTCEHEPEWEEHKDIFNPCEHCNIHTVGFCKKIYDFMKFMPAHKWPMPFRWERLELRKNEKPEHRVCIFDKTLPSIIRDCPGYQPKKAEGEADVSNSGRI